VKKDWAELLILLLFLAAATIALGLVGGLILKLILLTSWNIQ